MSINTRLVLIGGKSGAGKTTLINALLKKFPEFYTRPVSCTTRPQRKDEDTSEYEFIDETKLMELHNKNQFLNLDFVYGNYYAMKIDSINCIIGSGKIPIKEVHPSNHNKIRESFPKCVSALVKPLNSDRKVETSRADSDEAYYNTLNEDDFDIVYISDDSIPPDISAEYFHKKLSIFLCTLDQFPPTGLIDATNRAGYNKAADYFTEEKRITTRNFHELSECFFVESFAAFVKENDSILEIGPGRGWLYNIIQWTNTEYTCLDISSDMTSRNLSDRKITSSVRCIASESDKYDVVVSSLGDSYFYPEAICEITRVLKPNGYFILSAPSKEWANALRQSNKNKTTFVLDTGKEVQVFSFTYSQEEMCTLFKLCGLFPVILSSQMGILLECKEISPAILTAASNIGKSYQELDIVTTAIFQKER